MERPLDSVLNRKEPEEALPPAKGRDEELSIIEKMRDTVGESSLTGLTTYYCALCGTLSLITTSTPLSRVPRRSTDRSHVLMAGHQLQKHQLRKGEVKTIRRQKGLERQYRWNCSGCGVMVAYQSRPFEASAAEVKHFYVLPDAVTNDVGTSKVFAAAAEIPAAISLGEDKETRVLVELSPAAPEAAVKAIDDRCVTVALPGERLPSTGGAALIDYFNAVFADLDDAGVRVEHDGEQLFVIVEGAGPSTVHRALQKELSIFRGKAAARQRAEEKAGDVSGGAGAAAKAPAPR